MAYSEAVAERVRAALDAVETGEIKMFGGLCFTVGGHMCCGVLGDDLVVRIPPESAEAALGRPGARPMDFTGRAMKGFVYVGSEGFRTAKALQRWVDEAVRYARSLPPKRSKTGRRARTGRR